MCYVHELDVHHQYNLVISVCVESVTEMYKASLQIASIPIT